MKTYHKKYSSSLLLQAAFEVSSRLVSANGKCGFVGGAVRDLILGFAPKDIDMVTTLTPDEVVAVFPDAELIGASFGVCIVKHGGFCFEVATAREERTYLDGRHPELVKYTKDLAVDVERRDFTVNGLIYDCAKQEVIDYVGGVEDLYKGVLRTIGDPERRFAEDYLRLLRAVRFSAKYQLEIEAKTLDAIQRNAHNVRHLAAERIHAELDSMLTNPHPSLALELLDKTGLLAEILPEVHALKGVTQSAEFHPEGDVWTHTMLMLKHMVRPETDLAWSVLLHDVGKPKTRTEEKPGVIHFYNHETAGAEILSGIMNRLHFSNDSIRRIEKAVRNHMRFAHVKEMRPGKLRQLIGDENFPLELELHRLDCMCCHGFLDGFVFLLDKIAEQGGEIKLPEPLVRGQDLLARKWRPSPRLGAVLKGFYERQLSGELTSREKALSELDDISPE